MFKNLTAMTEVCSGLHYSLLIIQFNYQINNIRLLIFYELIAYIL